MNRETSKRLDKLHRDCRSLPSSKERIQYLQRAIALLEQEHAEKYHRFQKELNSSELNADATELQMSLDEEELAIGRVRLWLMDESTTGITEDSPSPFGEPIEPEPAVQEKVSKETAMESKTRKYMTPEEVAEYLNISVHTIKKWASEQRIPVSKLNGKHNRFIREEIDRWVKANGKKVIR
jgi:excisionase family DNA binding protein